MTFSLPTITTPEMLVATLKIWQQKLQPALAVVAIPRCPFNFRVAGNATGATGLTLNWEQVYGADGYQIQMSTNGDFSTASVIATLTNPAATAWFDSTAVTGVQRWYRIRSTAGTVSKPQSVFSVWSAPAANTSGSGTTTYNPIINNSGSDGWNPPNRGGNSGYRNPRINTL